MNNITLTGRLVNDPETRTVGDNNNLVGRYRLAVDRPKKKDKEKEADFINCVVFGRLAEIAEQYLKKGDSILVQGSVRTGSYQNKNGDKVFTFDVHVANQEFIRVKSSSSSKSLDKEEAEKLSGDGFMPYDENYI